MVLFNIFLAGKYIPYTLDMLIIFNFSIICYLNIIVLFLNEEFLIIKKFYLLDITNSANVTRYTSIANFEFPRFTYIQFTIFYVFMLVLTYHIFLQKFSAFVNIQLIRRRSEIGWPDNGVIGVWLDFNS